MLLCQTVILMIIIINLKDSNVFPLFYGFLLNNNKRVKHVKKFFYKSLYVKFRKLQVHITNYLVYICKSIIRKTCKICKIQIYTYV